MFKTLEKYRPGDKIKVVVNRMVGDNGKTERVVLQVKLKGSDEISR